MQRTALRTAADAGRYAGLVPDALFGKVIWPLLTAGPLFWQQQSCHR